MFVVKPCETFQKSVNFKMLQSDGTYKSQDFMATFARKPQSEIEAHIQGENEDDTGSKFLKEVLIGWSGIKNSEGGDFDFSDANRDALLDITEVKRAVMKAYFEAYTGVVGKK